MRPCCTGADAFRARESPVKVRLLPSSPDQPELQHLVSFVVNDHLAIDAGCIGFCGSIESQAQLMSVVLTHGHLDHVCSLPVFAMNVASHARRGVVVWATDAVIASLRDRKSTRLNSSHVSESRMPSSA